MKKRFKNMDEVYKAAEKTAQEQAFHRADTKDSEERLADYTIASAHEDKFNDSVFPIFSGDLTTIKCEIDQAERKLKTSKIRNIYDYR